MAKPNPTKHLDIDRLCTSCLTQTEKNRITARTVHDYCISPFMVYCNNFVSPEMKDPISEYGQLLMKEGKIHEGQVLAEKYPGLKPTEFVTPEAGFRLVLEAMQKGIEAVTNAPVFYLPEGLLGVADIIEKRKNAPSVFGDYHYIVKEIKLAKNLEKRHLFQGALYNYVIGKIQGYTPSTFYMVNRDHEEFETKYDEQALLEIVTDIREILNGKKVSPTYDACQEPWETYNNQEAIRLHDISLVNGCGPSLKKRLLENGIETFDQLAGTEKAKLIKIKGIADKTATKLLQHSNTLVLGKHICIGTCNEFPKRATEIFLDLEGTGEQVGEEEVIAMDYLIGVLIRKDGKAEYIPFLAEGLDKEKEMLDNFVGWVEKQTDFIIYHWHHYESTHLLKMAKRYNLPQSELDLVFANMRDLHKDATAAFSFPTYGNGLKEIAPYIGYKWKHQEVDATEAIAIYLEYVKDKEANKDKMQKVIDYNNDDCEATLLIKDWLEKELKT
jgi:uncharacterized protein